MTINLPYTQNQLAQSHDFQAFIFPQTSGNFDFLSLLNLSITEDVIGGITKVEKQFKKGVKKRKKLGELEAHQAVPITLEYDFTIEKIVLYENSNKFNKALQVEQNGFIKQLVPFLMQETIKKPNGDIKSNTFYTDVWITQDVVVVDINGDDQKEIRNITATGCRLLEGKDDYLGYLEALGTSAITSLQSFKQTSEIMSNFKIL